MSHCADPLTLFFFWFSPQHIDPICEYAVSAVAQPVPFVPLEYLKQFALTNVLEAPFYLWLLRAWPARRGMKLMILANLATHPLIYFLFPFLCHHMELHYATYLTISENFAIFAEIAIAYRFGRQSFLKTAIAIALANIFSWWVGVTI